MSRSPSDLRMQARDLERDARELEEVLRTLDFLENHDAQPEVEVTFTGFKSDGARAADQIAAWVTKDWPARKIELQEHFRARRKELEERWA